MVAKVTITFDVPTEFGTPLAFTYEVPDDKVPLFKGAIAAHQKHGYVEYEVQGEMISLDENGDPILDGNGDPVMVPAVDGDGNPVMVTRRDPGTFETGLESWSDLNVRDGILAGVDAYETAVIEAQVRAGIEAQKTAIPVTKKKNR